MKTAITLILIGLAATSLYMLSSSTNSDVESQFQDFLSTYKVGYSNDYEYDYRFKVFQKNLETIAELNKTNPNATFGVNKFADKTPQEMERRLGLTKEDTDTCEYQGGTLRPDSGIDHSRHYLNGVKDQGECGSGWAFAAAGTAEGRYAFQNDMRDFTTSFSEQQLVDCDNHSSGCSEGSYPDALSYWKENDLCLEGQYEYKGVEGTCQKCKSGIRMRGCYQLIGRQENILGELGKGPVAVGVDASSWAFYTSGIISNCTESRNHAATMVGNSMEENYVKIRNSWGADWGEEGYVRLQADNGACGWSGYVYIAHFHY